MALIAISQLVTLAGPRERQVDSVAACQEMEDLLPASSFPVFGTMLSSTQDLRKANYREDSKGK